MLTNIYNRNQNYTEMEIFHAIPLFEKADPMNNYSMAIGLFQTNQYVCLSSA